MTSRRTFIADFGSWLLVRPATWLAARLPGSLRPFARRRKGPSAVPLPRIQGINVHTPDARSLTLLQELSIRNVRYTLFWRAWADTRPANDGTTRTIGEKARDDFLAAVDTLRGAGIEVIVVVHTPPVGMTFAQGLAALPDFMAARARERPGMIWQIMNEMDGNDAFSNGWFSVSDRNTTQNERGDLYGQLLAPVNNAIKQADPTARVVTGGIVLEPTAFYAGLHARSPGAYDAVCVHAYGTPVTAQFRTKSIKMRAVVDGTQLWCTEWGDNSTNDAAQAADIAATLDDEARNDRYDRNYLYALITDTASGDTYGIVRPDGTRRRAMTVLLERQPS